MIVEKYPAPRFLGTRQALEEGESVNVYWVLGAENPAYGLTDVRSDVAPSFRLLDTRHLNPECLRPWKGAAR